MWLEDISSLALQHRLDIKTKGHLLQLGQTHNLLSIVSSGPVIFATSKYC